MRLALLALSCFLAFLVFPHRISGDPGSNNKWAAVKRWNLWTKVTYEHLWINKSECGGHSRDEDHEETITTGPLEFLEHISDDSIDVISWTSNLGRASGSESQHDESVDCDGRTITSTLNGSGSNPEPFFIGLHIDLKKGTYSLGAHNGANYTLHRRVVTPEGTQSSSWDSGGGYDIEIEEPLPGGSTTVLSGMRVLDKPPHAGHGQKLTVNWRLTPGDREDVELLVDPDQYDKWLPEGGKDEKQIGNQLAIFVKLRAKDGKEPQQKAKRIVFELTDTSQIPGVCDNYPRDAKTDHDFQFGEETNPELKVTGKGQQAETKPGEYTEAYAILDSYDFGGYSTLKVTAYLTDGQEVTGHLKSDKSQTEIRIPKRTPDSKIGEAWKKRENVESLSDGDDGEETPKLDGHNGDGLTLYEEYRGFMEDGEHFRAKPKRKELFIVDKVGGRSKDGIALLRTATDLLIYDKLLQTEADENGVVNANHGGKIPRRGSNWAVRLENNPDPKIRYAEGVGKTGGPKKVLMGSGFDPGPGGWNTAWGKRIITDDYAATVAHEILHCLRVSHHGNTDPGRKWWIKDMGDRGQLVVREYDMLGDNQDEVAKAGHVIRVLTENGRELRPDSPELSLPTYHYVGAANGQHSGHEDCLMRYKCADVYVSPSDGDMRYLAGDEITGIGLCKDAHGTGVNDPGRKPRSRYGDASAGNCFEQPCVNDSAH